MDHSLNEAEEQNNKEVESRNEDVNNNNCKNENNLSKFNLDEAAVLTAKLAANARAAAAAAFMPGHVTLEALENTKIAVAQFATNALANPNNEAALKELTLLQSTLFTLQHQQVLQLQLIQQLHSHLNTTQTTQSNNNITESSDHDESELEDEETYERDEKENLERRKRELETSNIPLSPDSPQHYCSWLSLDITNPVTPPQQSAPNSLEILQKRTQEVLDLATQGVLSGTMTDELTSDAANDSKDAILKHRCRYCGKIFSSDSALQIHLRSHTGERRFKCNVCGSRFTTKGNLKVHFQRHSSQFPHILMNQHQIPEHLDKLHSSLISPLSPTELSPNANPSSKPFPGPPFFQSPLDLVRPPNHSIIGLSIDNDEDDNRLSDLKSYEKGRLPPTRSPSPTNESTSTLTIKLENKDEVVDLNERQTSNQSGRLSHHRSPRFDTPSNFEESFLECRILNMFPTRVINENIPSKNIPHPHCSPLSTSSTTGSIKNHRLPIHPDLLHDPVKDPISYTSLLPRPGSNDNSWESLIEVTKSSETAKLQQLVDNLENKITDPNECIVCHRVLSCKSALQMHYRTHTGERPFRCRICGRAFTTKGNLKTHMGVHRMKPPLRTLPQCPVCHKKFVNALVLQQHIRLHMGEPTNLTPEQISASEVQDFPLITPGQFPIGITPFGIPMPGLHRKVSESSQADHEDFIQYNDDFDDSGSVMDDTGSVKGSIYGCPNSETSISNISAIEYQVKAITSMASQLSAGNVERTSSEILTNGGEKSPCISASSSKRARLNSSTCALDLTPKLTQQCSNSINTPFGMFSILGTEVPAQPKLTSHTQTSNLPLTPFKPLVETQLVRGGNSTCSICLKTFACHSALEIHFRSHTKERPFKCTICDRGFSTKNEEMYHSHILSCKTGNMKQHMLTHKMCDIPKHMVNSNSNSSDFTTLNHKQPSHNNCNGESWNKYQIDIKLPGNPISLSKFYSDDKKSEIADNQNDIDDYNTSDMIPKHTIPSTVHQDTTNKEGVVENMEPIKIKVEPEFFQLSDDDYSEDDDEPLSKRLAIKLTNSDASATLSTDTTTPANNSNDLVKLIVTDVYTAPTNPKPIINFDKVVVKTSSGLSTRNSQGAASHLQNTNKINHKHLSSESQPLSLSQSSPINTKHYCFICRKNFSSTSALQIHNRTHTGDKPFQCNVCQKAFTTKGNLKVHMGTHMWTNGASRRGRRMSLELPLKHPLHLSPQDAVFLQQRPELLYPYVQPQVLNEIHLKMAEINSFHHYSATNEIQHRLLNKHSELRRIELDNRATSLTPKTTNVRSTIIDRHHKWNDDADEPKSLVNIRMQPKTQIKFLKT